MTSIAEITAIKTCRVYRAGDFSVVFGANLGDAANTCEALALGDLYALARDAEAWVLCYQGTATGGESSPSAAQQVAEGSDTGMAGTRIKPRGRLNLMADDGAPLELLLMRIGQEDFIRPLNPLVAGREYTLLGAEEDTSDVELAEMACVSFTRGTRITLSTGEQRPVEALNPGDRVLTRDHGAQPVRWIGQQTARAHGAYAPVLITKGALHNAADLVLSPDHRLFIYQRQDRIGAGQAEVLVRARNLVDDETIFQREGGFVDYFHLLFDAHEIIYAEGIPAESLLVTSHTLAALPEDMAHEVKARFPAGAREPHRGVESDLKSTDGRNLAAELKRASLG